MLQLSVRAKISLSSCNACSPLSAIIPALNAVTNAMNCAAVTDHNPIPRSVRKRHLYACSIMVDISTEVTILSRQLKSAMSVRPEVARAAKSRRQYDNPNLVATLLEITVDRFLKGWDVAFFPFLRCRQNHGLVSVRYGDQLVFHVNQLRQRVFLEQLIVDFSYLRCYIQHSSPSRRRDDQRNAADDDAENDCPYHDDAECVK